jgi:enoyl-CoA hydratase/carnithine racemase
MTDNVSAHNDKGVLCIELNRADKKNAITVAMYQKMTDIVQSAQEDSEVRSILWRASGDDFCAGNDLMDFIQNPALGEEAPVMQFIYSLARNQVPMVAAVQGKAVGIGATLLLHCDAVVLADNAQLMMPFTKLGLLPEAGCTKLLTELIGYQRAVKMAILGDTVTAPEAIQMGLATQVVAPSAVPDAGLNLANRFADLPKTATRQARSLMRPSPEVLIEAMRAEAVFFSEALQSEATKEAFTAHFEKRAANFRAID